MKTSLEAESRNSHVYKCFGIETKKNGVSHLVMNRPAQLNSMIKEFWTELPQVIEMLEEAGQTRVIVLSAEGKHFSAGMDLSVFQSGDLKTDTPQDREKLKRLVLGLQSTFNALEQCRIPIIAAVHGACIGGAFDMIAACDMRYATTDATFKIQEINLAMMADLGGLQRLPYLLPDAVLRELAFTGTALTAERALSLGLVNEVFPDQKAMLAHVMGVADAIASRAPLAISASKEAINFARDHSIQDALLHCANLQASIFSTADLTECMRAQKESRETVFGNLHGLKRSL